MRVIKEHRNFPGLYVLSDEDEGLFVFDVVTGQRFGYSKIDDEKEFVPRTLNPSREAQILSKAFDPDQPRDEQGRRTDSGSGSGEKPQVDHAVVEAKILRRQAREMREAANDAKKAVHAAGKTKHLEGQHDQSTHGNRGGEGSAHAEARSDAVKYLGDRGGFTYSLTGKQPKEGLALSPYKDRETKIPFKEFDSDALRAFEDRNKDLLSRADHYIGGWHNTEDGNVYLDVSIVVSSRDRAEALAREHQQLAYYDLGRGEVVNVSKAYDPGQPRDESGRWAEVGGGEKLPTKEELAKRDPEIERAMRPSAESSTVLGVSVRFGDPPKDSEEYFEQHAVYPRLISSGASPEQARMQQLEHYRSGKEQLKLDTEAALKTAAGAGWPLPKAVSERSWATFSNDEITGRYAHDRDEIDISSSAISVYNDRRVRNVEDGWWVQNNTILHELAHQAHHKANPGMFDRMMGRSPDRNLTREERSVASKVSLYAQSDRLEFIAETASGLALGKDYDKDVLDMYKRLGGPTIRGRILSKGGIAPIPKR